MFNVNSHSSPYIIIANSILVSWIKSSTTIQFVIQMGQVRLHLWHYSTLIWWKFVSWTDSVDVMTPMEKQDCSRPKFAVCFVVVSLLIDMNLSFLIRLSSSKNMRNWFRSRRQNTEMEEKKHSHRLLISNFSMRIWCIFVVWVWLFHYKFSVNNYSIHLNRLDSRYDYYISKAKCFDSNFNWRRSTANASATDNTSHDMRQVRCVVYTCIRLCLSTDVIRL